MGPALRISGHRSLTITLDGLTTGEADALRTIIRSSDDGTGLGPAQLLVPKGSGDTRSVPVLTGAPAQLRHFARFVASHGGLSTTLSRKINSLLDNYLRSDYKIMCRGRVLELSARTRIMGILNATPDSFSDGGLYFDENRALHHAREMAAAGADIIDIGGESTRPGAQAVSEDEELRRIIPLVTRLSAEFSIPVSVDTYKATVAKKALEAGASIVNDISGLRFSPDMAKVVADFGAALIIMHIKGTPRDMQQDPVYDDVLGEISSFLGEGVELAVQAGVERENILIDPGIGFGKTLEHNLTILNRLDEFRVLGRPLVLGTSRKRFIGMVLGVPAAEQRAFGTAATAALGIERGARVLRVHDVKQMAQVARMTDAIVRAANTTFQAPNNK